MTNRDVLKTPLPLCRFGLAQEDGELDFFSLFALVLHLLNDSGTFADSRRRLFRRYCCQSGLLEAWILCARES